MKLLDFVVALPAWVWVIAGILLVLFIFGDQLLWDYEVIFPFVSSVGQGKIALERGKKKGTTLEARFTLTPSYQQCSLEFHLNNSLIYTVLPQKNKSGKIRIKTTLSLDEPQEGDLVQVKCQDIILFSGHLVSD